MNINSFMQANCNDSHADSRAWQQILHNPLRCGHGGFSFKFNTGLMLVVQNTPICKMTNVIENVLGAVGGGIMECEPCHQCEYSYKTRKRR